MGELNRSPAATVVARATPEGEGGLAVIRISGPDAMAIARRVFRGPGFGGDEDPGGAGPVARRAVYGILHEPLMSEVDEDQRLEVIDEILALPLPGPRSYTGEDTVELFCHGGREVAARAVAACRAAGAEPAPPGEFTRRAFLNGRLTLDQAEAVADLIQAGSEQAARAAIAQLRGGLDAELGAVEWPLLDLLVRLEGSLEFVDDDDDVAAVPPKEIRLTLEEARDGIDDLLALAPAGRLLREGVHVVLAGPPNAGKSSLFNRMLGSDRALVDDEPGTTRDVVTASVRRGGRLYVLHDTAGLREDAGRVEAMGISRARETAAGADLVLMLADAAAKPDWPAPVPGTGPAPAPAWLRVLTKVDLAPPVDAGADAIATSSVTGAGLDALWGAIENQVAQWRLDDAVNLGVVLNERHRHRLAECRDELTQLLALHAHDPAPGAEVTGTLLASLLARLGEISGRVFSEQLLDGVFRRFCVGK